MSKGIVFMATVALACLPRLAGADSCPVLPDTQRACQDTVSKAALGYTKSHLKAVQTCLSKIQNATLPPGDPATMCRGSVGTPPTDAPTADKLADAAAKVVNVLGSRCTDADVAALDLCAPTVAGLAACLVEDHYPQIDSALGAQFGTVTQSVDPSRMQCQTTIANQGAKYLSKYLRTVQRCLASRNKKECATDEVVSKCLAPQPDGPKYEAKAANKIQRLRDKMALTLANSSCAGAGVVDGLDACGSTNAELLDCLQCNHDQVASILVAGEHGSVRLATPSSTIQAAVSAADEGDTVLVTPGTYTETVEIQDSGLSLIGLKDCTTGDRAVMESPNPGVTPDGIFACGSLAPSCTHRADDLLFQGLEVRHFQDNAIFTVGIEGVVFRDVVTVGDGTNTGMEYGPFPILSNDVLIEDSEVIGVRDAGIYVGQSTNIIVRNNVVHDNVAGIEIENSANSQVYGNHAYDNTGGILVFKLPGLSVQLSNCNEVFDNLIENNNTPNFGSGTVGLVPRGTGILILSGDSVHVHDNMVTGNETFGLVATDQYTLNLLNDPDPFPMLSPDAAVSDNFYIGNTLTGNGTNPDPAGGGFSGDFFSVLLDPGTSGNCGQGNTLGAGTFPLPACTSPTPPGCPLPPSTSTTVTSTTVTTTSTSTSTTLPASWAAIQAAVIGPTCGGCHGGSGGLDDLADCNLGLADMVDVASSRLPSMDRIEPGDSANSWLVHKLEGTHTTFEPGCTGPGGSCGNQMPLGGPFFEQHIIDSLKAWIDAGAINDCP
jgi:parallel beta-helix repeat protein